MALADDLQADVAAVLDDPDYGRDVTLRKTMPGAYNPSTGAVGATSPVDVATRGILISYRDSQINGTTILQGDRKCIIKADINPFVGDKLLVGGEALSIISVKRVPLGDDGTVIVYILQVRK